MSDPVRTMKAIIEALRMKGRDPGIYREPGQVPRRVNGPMDLGDAQQTAQYNRYRKVQTGAGETPVSYEEWLRR